MTTYDENGNPEDESGELPTDEEDLESESQDETPVKLKTEPAPPPAPAQKLVKKPRPGVGKKPPGKPDAHRTGPSPKLNEVGLAALTKKRQEGSRPGVGTGIREADRAVVPESINPAEEPTGDAMVRWPMVLDMLKEQHLGPEAVAIRVWAITDGPYATAPAQVGTIDGRAVAGGADLSSADQLRDYVETVFHSVLQKPAKYALDIYYKVAPPWRAKGGNMICRGEIVLPSYEQLVQQRQRAAEFLRRQPPGVGSTAASMPTLQGYPQVVPSATPGGQPTIIMPPPPAAPGYQPNPMQPMFEAMQQMMTEMFGRVMRGEPIGPPAPAPVVLPPPAAVPHFTMPEIPKPPTVKEQLETVAELVALVDKIRPPAAPQATGVGRAAREVATEPANPFAGFRDAMKMIRDFKQMQEEFGLGGGGDGGDDGGEERVPAEPVEKPFEVMDVPGVGKWPHGKGLSTVEQIKAFAMLNPNITMAAVERASGLIDRSVVGEFFRYLMERGNPAQRLAAQNAIAGMGRPAAPAPSPPPAMPPVVRPPAITATANGAAPSAETPPAPGGWAPMA